MYSKPLSKDLINLVRQIVQESRGKKPMTDKEKALAALAPPHDEITHADVLVGRGVLKKHPKTGKIVAKDTK